MTSVYSSNCFWSERTWLDLWDARLPWKLLLKKTYHYSWLGFVALTCQAVWSGLWLTEEHIAVTLSWSRLLKSANRAGTNRSWFNSCWQLRRDGLVSVETVLKVLLNRCSCFSLLQIVNTDTCTMFSVKAEHYAGVQEGRIYVANKMVSNIWWYKKMSWKRT